MRLLIIRHGDPDYEKDSLTEKGWKEAALLADRMARIPVSQYFVSTMGRASDTAFLTLQKTGAKAVYCDWLREFSPRIDRPDRTDRQTISWDWLPQDWTEVDSFYSRDSWHEHPVFRAAGVHEQYTLVTKEFDKVLAANGYERNGRLYKAVRPNRDVLAFFCHFGLECVLLSHLMNVSPMVLWHHTCAAPTAVTSVYTEERREGTAIFRMNYFGDISHLYAGGEPASFSARFCETWDDETERHD